MIRRGYRVVTTAGSDRQMPCAGGVPSTGSSVLRRRSWRGVVGALDAGMFAGGTNAGRGTTLGRFCSTRPLAHMLARRKAWGHEKQRQGACLLVYARL